LSTRTFLICENVLTIVAITVIFCYTKSPWALLLLLNINTRIP